MRIIFLVIAVVILVLVYDGVRMYVLVKKSVALVKNSVAFERKRPQARMRILVLGDSTAVGTGAQHKEDSTAGRLGARYPDAEVINLAQNGLRISGLLDILNTIQPNEHFDIVLIQIGANDIIRQTTMSDIEEGIGTVLARTQTLGEKVIVLHSGNVGEAEFFPWYVRPLLSRRSMNVRTLYQNKSAVYGARYVDLIDTPTATFLKENPDRYYANDLLHLSSDGYGLWFDEISKHI